MTRLGAGSGSKREQPPRYGGKLLVARASMVWEQLWRGLWPALSVIVLFLALALFGVLPVLPGWLHALVLAALLGAFLVLAWTGMRGVAVPAPQAGGAGWSAPTNSGIARSRPSRTAWRTASAGPTPKSSGRNTGNAWRARPGASGSGCRARASPRAIRWPSGSPWPCSSSSRRSPHGRTRASGSARR